MKILKDLGMMITENGSKRRFYIMECETCKSEYTVRSDFKKSNCNKCSWKERGLKSRKWKTKEDRALKQTWRNMIDRCYLETDKRYRLYGAKGVTVCKEWKEDIYSFISWAKDNGYEKGLHLDKDILSDGLKIYSPETCKWVTHKENTNCTSRSKYITHNGKTQTLADWARELKFNYSRVNTRLHLGWSFEKATKEKGS